MRSRKHKRRMNRFLIVTSDSTTAQARHYLLRSGILWGIILLLCIVMGAMIGYFRYDGDIWQDINARNEQQTARINELTEQNLALSMENDSLKQNIQILSDTVNEKTQTEAELKKAIEGQSIPTEFPLTGSATVEEEFDGENQICVFSVSAGTTVRAAASGTIVGVEDDEGYGHSITIDHGNGYTTIYKNSGDVYVKLGDSVVCGTTLYIITNDNGRFGYQIMQNGQYINPIDMLEIDG